MNGFWTRTRLAFRAFFSILFRGSLADEIVAAAIAAREARGEPSSQHPAVSHATVQTAGPAPPGEAAPDRAVQMLALLQRDGRLVDFLMEDLSGYSDAQVGAAARDVHGRCRQTLARYVTVESVVEGQEGETITVQARPDPAAVRLIGNVAGQPPFRGTLLHKGWRAVHVALPPLVEGSGRTIVAQAEVEVM
ncbi:MAG: DUF2760 domain-containing protein [Vicinamibacterales bacterium]